MSAFYDLSKTPRNILNQAIVRAIVSENNGLLFDPSDMSTLYQDAAGTIPVTAVEQPVGKMLDKSGNGYHATQSITASRPTLSARYNLLTKTEDFSDAVWVKQYSVVSARITHASGVLVNVLTEDATTNLHYIREPATVVPGNIYKYTCVLGKKDRKYAALYGSTPGVGVIFDLESCSFFSNLISAPLNYSVRALGNGLCECSISYVATSTSTAPAVYVCNDSGQYIYAGDGVSGIYLARAELRDAASFLPYQRVNTATDYDTDERYFPKYLRFDGVDDYLVLPYMGLYANGSASMVMARDTIIPSSQQNYLTEASSTSTPPLYYLDFQLSGQLNQGFFIRNDANTQVALLSNNNGESVSTVSVKTMVDNGNNVKKYRNGTLLNSDNYVRSGTLALSNTLIGAIGYGTPVNFAKMNLYGLILTKSALTYSKRVACERYLGRKSGVQL